MSHNPSGFCGLIDLAAALLPWPELTYGSPEEETFKKLLAEFSL